MKLDYIARVTENGDDIIRLSEFDKLEATKFSKTITRLLVNKSQSFSLDTVDYIDSRNCKLIMRIAEENIGINTYDNKNFFCDMTVDGYKKMVSLIAPFCKKESKGHQYLYEIDSDIEFLFSPAGTR